MNIKVCMSTTSLNPTNDHSLTKCVNKQGDLCSWASHCFNKSDHLMKQRV